jgi:uncharacterized membrane protein (DUF4010 family)
LSLFVPIVLAVSPPLLPLLAPELIAAALVLLVGGLLGLRGGESAGVPAPTADTRMFRFGQALWFALLIALVLLIAAAMSAWLGPRGALITACVAALAEVHASFASLAQLFHEQVLSAAQVRWGLVGLLATSVLAKSVVAFVSGGRAYGLRVAAGLLVTVGAALAARLFSPWS